MPSQFVLAIHWLLRKLFPSVTYQNAEIAAVVVVNVVFWTGMMMVVAMCTAQPPGCEDVPCG